MVLLWGKPDWKETGGCDGLLAALREVSVARACSARSREGSSFTSAAKKGLQSFGEGVSAWLHSQSGMGDSITTSSSTLPYITVYYNISHCILQCTTVYHSHSKLTRNGHDSEGDSNDTGWTVWFLCSDCKLVAVLHKPSAEGGRAARRNLLSVHHCRRESCS